jgi:hypothetical protein
MGQHSGDCHPHEILLMTISALLQSFQSRSPPKNQTVRRDMMTVGTLHACKTAQRRGIFTRKETPKQ